MRTHRVPWKLFEATEDLHAIRDVHLVACNSISRIKIKERRRCMAAAILAYSWASGSVVLAKNLHYRRAGVRLLVSDAQSGGFRGISYISQKLVGQGYRYRTTLMCSVKCGKEVLC